MSSLKQKKVIDILCGGISPEHEVSVSSAVSIINQLIHNNEYCIHVVYISNNGNWYRAGQNVISHIDEQWIKSLEKNENSVFPVLSSMSHYFDSQNHKIEFPDVFFPVLHGPYGEDGTLQGFLECIQRPYVGCDVLGSSCGMNKKVMRQLFEVHQFNLLKWSFYSYKNWLNQKEKVLRDIQQSFEYPLFIKPCCGGSSIGVSKVSHDHELAESIDHAFQFDNEIIVEEGREVREIECAVLGREETFVSECGEIVPGSDFYDYEDKYKNGLSKSRIPASIDSVMTKTIKEMAIKAFHAVNGKGLSRIDFFVDKKTNEIFINEVNTFPGFTSISMYPLLMDYSGVSFKELLCELIDLSVKDFIDKKRLKNLYKKNQIR